MGAVTAPRTRGRCSVGGGSRGDGTAPKRPAATLAGWRAIVGARDDVAHVWRSCGVCVLSVAGAALDVCARLEDAAEPRAARMGDPLRESAGKSPGPSSGSGGDPLRTTPHGQRRRRLVGAWYRFGIPPAAAIGAARARRGCHASGQVLPRASGQRRPRMTTRRLPCANPPRAPCAVFVQVASVGARGRQRPTLCNPSQRRRRSIAHNAAVGRRGRRASAGARWGMASGAARSPPMPPGWRRCGGHCGRSASGRVLTVPFWELS